MNLERFKSEVQTRSFHCRADGTADEKKRTVELAFSSEEPYLRAFGWEILDHSPNSIRTDRIKAGAPLLVDHDRTDHVGVIESVTVDGDRRARAVVRFGRGPRATEIFNDVVDGIRTQVSVGYKIHSHKDEGEADDGNAIYRITDWEPHEISITSIAADPTVGVGRSFGDSNMENENLSRSERRRAKNEQQTDQERIAAIRSMSQAHDLPELGMQAIAEGWSQEDFNQRALNEVSSRNDSSRSESTFTQGAPEHTPSHYAGLPCDNGQYGRAMEEYSLHRLLRHLTDPQKHEAGLEREIGQDVERVSGRNALRGLMVPWEAFGPSRNDPNMMVRDVTAGGSGGNLIATNLMGGSFIDVLRARSRVMSLGATTLPGLVGDVAVPRKTATATGYWFAADGSDSITESDQTYDQVTLSPKFLGAGTRVSYKALMQSTPALENLTRQDFIDLWAVTLDWAAIQGTGASNQPEGVVNTTGINAATYANGGSPGFSDIVGMETLISADNADASSMAYLATPTIAGGLKTTDIGTDTGMMTWHSGPNAQGVMNGYQAYSSSNVPAGSVILGDWSSLLIGMWAGVEIDIDRYGTNFLAGTSTFRMIATVDVATRHPESFCLLDEAAP